MLTFLIKNAATPLTKFIAGILGQQLLGLGLKGAVAGVMLQRACSLLQGTVPTYTDANDQNIVEGTAGIVTTLFAFLGVAQTDALPIVVGAAGILAAQTA